MTQVGGRLYRSRNPVMSGPINLLPCELIARILEEASYRNAQDIPTFSYGLSRATGKDSQLQLSVRGNSVPDALRWRATEAIRQVNGQWHDWAAKYALRDLYITRWRGSERYVSSIIGLGVLIIPLTWTLSGGCNLATSIHLK